MIRMRFSCLVIAASLLGSAAVYAQEAYTTRTANVRAGPDRDYPLVAQLAPGTPVSVAGCVSDYLWCDVIFDGNRGWIYAESLQYVYQNRWVPIYGYGAVIGLPIITFSIMSYWDNYYRARPFYRDRPRWEHRPYRGRPGFVPAPRPHAPEYRRPHRPDPHTRPPRRPDPQSRPPRPVEPRLLPPPVSQPRVQQPPARPPGGREGGRPRGAERNFENPGFTEPGS